MFDLIIRGGMVVDGSGEPSHRADVGVRQGRVAVLGLLREAQAERVIEAHRCVVTPGFVDMHSHADTVLPALPGADSLVQQGITTVVVGQCGSSPVPLLPETRDEVVASRASGEVTLPWERWSTFASYLADLRDTGVAVNVVPLVGQAAVREAVLGFTAASPSVGQIARMQAEVKRAMAEGAIGVSTGLIYPPGSYADTEELVEVVRPVGERGGYYFTHIRGEGDTLLEAVSEALEIGRRTGASVQISHFKAAGAGNWPKATRALDLIENARAEGLDVAADMYPYLAGSSSLVSMIPEWAQEGGREPTLCRLADPQTRARMSADMESVGFFRGARWDQVFIASSPCARQYEGRYVADLAAEGGVAPHTWVFDALLETGLQIQMISHYACEENLALQLGRSWMMIGTDAGGRATTGPFAAGFPHPRNYGTFPRVLGRYVRELGVLSLEDAVHRMTGLPARRLRWTSRGLLREGYAADLVVFDPQTIADRATYEAPHQYPVGIEAVVVNGRLVVHRGVHTGTRPGEILG